MTASTYSHSLASRFAVPKAHRIPPGYFRSKLFVLSSSMNPLVTAAGPLFSLLERLSASATLPPIHHLHDNIKHELHAFQSRTASYADEFTAIAHFLVTTTIDELLGKNYVRVFGKPANFTAFTPSSHDQQGPEHRFFEIVNYLKDRGPQYLDLLELTYYCLITGFEGAQHGQADGRQKLDNLIEELYQNILLHRAHKPHRLFKEQKAIPLVLKNNKPLVIATLFAFGLTTAAYCTSHLLIDQKAKSVLWGRAMLAKRELAQHG